MGFQSAPRHGWRLDAEARKRGAFIGAAGQVERRDARRFQHPRDLDHLLGRVAILAVFGAGDADPEREVGQRVAQAMHRFQQQPRAVLQGAAIFVRPLVDARGQELVEQVAIGRVQFDGIVARLPQPPRGIHKILLDGSDLRALQRPHLVTGVGVLPGRRPHRFHVQHHPPQQCTTVVDLADGHAVMPLDGLHQPRQARDEAVVIDPERVVVRPSAFADGHGLGDDGRDATLGAFLVIGAVAFGRETVAGAEIRPHRRHDEAVLHAERPDHARAAQKRCHAGHASRPRPCNGTPATRRMEGKAAMGSPARLRGPGSARGNMASPAQRPTDAHASKAKCFHSKRVPYRIVGPSIPALAPAVHRTAPGRTAASPHPIRYGASGAMAAAINAASSAVMSNRPNRNWYPRLLFPRAEAAPTSSR